MLDDNNHHLSEKVNAEGVFTVTVFPNAKSRKKEERTLDLAGLVNLVAKPRKTNKAALPLVKLGTFGDAASKKGCLRTNENLQEITGIEVDYDLGEITPEEATTALEEAGVTALVHTSPSHGQDGKGNRWRALLPTSKSLPPSARYDLVSRVNGLFRGELADESFTDSQAFYIGTETGLDPVETHIAEGQPIDLAEHLDPDRIGRACGRKADLGPPVAAEDQSDKSEAVEAAQRVLKSHIAKLSEAEAGSNRLGEINRAAFTLGGYVACGTLTESEVLEAMQVAADANGAAHDYGDNVARVALAGLSKGVLRPIPVETAAMRAAAFDELLDDFGGLPPDPEIDDLLGADPYFTSAADLLRRSAPPREWLVRDWLPARTVHMMGGDGGTGKSLLAMQLAVATVTGTPWVGLEIEQPGPVVYYGAEDETDEMHRRLEAICAGAEIEGRALRSLFLRSAVGEDTIFATVGADGRVKPTPLMKHIARELRAVRPSLVVLDTLANVHALDPNNQEQAKAFVNLLAKIALKLGCTVLLLSHPSRSGMASGEGDGFSVAWHNSARSRSYLQRDTKKPEIISLTKKKANYAGVGESLRMTWKAGRFVEVTEDVADDYHTKRVFLIILDRFRQQDRYVNDKLTGNFAPRLFAEEPEATEDDGRITKDDFAGAMREMLRDGHLVLEDYTNSNRKKAVRLAAGKPLSDPSDMLTDDPDSEDSTNV